MKHLLICREYPPAPSGGIGTYAVCISRLLAESGETVHVIGQQWKGAENAVEEQCDGRLVIHRVPFEDWTAFRKGRPHPAIAQGGLTPFFRADLPVQCFTWQAALLAEKLVADEGIEVIEAQEYEAPLYYFQLRRSLGLGPRATPPCLVHLHSPSEFIARHNGWPMDAPRVRAATRLESHSIAAADGLLCPSRYLAAAVEQRYRLAAGTVAIVPYPAAEGAVLDRDADSWENGTVCYVGRLEPRKGVLEWIAAAVGVARDYPSVGFEFIGSNALGVNRVSGHHVLQQLVPPDVESRFHFRGEQKRSALPGFLRRARIAVVPSRWENFPYSCIEAMLSGLPVIATREGGMAEMIRDGESGWLASAATPAGLAAALRRALDTPSTEVRRMGQQAAIDIREVCDDGKIVAARLALARRLVNRGGVRFALLPPNVPSAPGAVADSVAAFIALEPRVGRRRLAGLLGSDDWSSAAYALRHPVKTALWLSQQRQRRRQAG